MPVLVLAIMLMLSSCVGDEPASEGVASLPGAPLHVPDEAWRQIPDILSATDAVRASEGWVVLDKASSGFWLIGGWGVRGPYGRKGEGPGELRHPDHLAVGDSTVWITSILPGHVDAFTVTGKYSLRLAVRPPCRSAMHEDLLARRSARGVIILYRCMGLPGAELVAVAHDIDGSHRRLGSWSLGDRGPLSLAAGRLVSLREGPYVAISDTPCLIPLEGTIRREDYCLDPDSQLQIPRSLRDSLARLVRERTGMAMEPPRLWPFLDAVFETGGLPVARRPSRSAGYVFEEYGPAGRARRLVLPDSAEAFLGGGEILLARPTLEGIRMVVVPYPGEGEP